MYARGVNVNLTPLISNRGTLATDAWESRVCDPLGTRYELGRCGAGRGCYIGAVTRTGVRFRGVNVTDVYARGVNVNLTPLTLNRGALATDAWESRVRDPLGTRYELGRCGPGRGCYIGAVTRTGVRFRGVNVTDVYARGVNVNLTPLTSNRGALATDAWESRVRDPLGTRYELGRCGPGRGCYIGAVTRTGVRFRGVNVTDVYARGVNVNLTPLTSNRGALATDARGCSL